MVDARFAPAIEKIPLEEPAGRGARKMLHGGSTMNNWTADFPILAADENGKRLVYLDSAATTQHPTQVLNAVVNYYTKENANPHRGVYELAMRATDAHEGAPYGGASSLTQRTRDRVHPEHHGGAEPRGLQLRHEFPT